MEPYDQIRRNRFASRAHKPGTRPAKSGGRVATPAASGQRPPDGQAEAERRIAAYAAQIAQHGKITEYAARRVRRLPMPPVCDWKLTVRRDHGGSVSWFGDLDEALRAASAAARSPGFVWLCVAREAPTVAGTVRDPLKSLGVL